MSVPVRRLVLVGLITLVLAVALTAVPGAPAERDEVALRTDTVVLADRGERGERTSRRPLVGVSPGFVVFDVPQRRLGADLAAVRRLGADRVRLDISWARVARGRGFDWRDTDRVIRTSRRTGLQVLGLVGYRPARGALRNGAPDPVGFGRFVAAAALRYGPQVAAWEIWNEPNLRSSWIARPDPRAYARVATAAALAIRLHDPRAPIAIGALAPAVNSRDGNEIAPETFLSEVYRAGLDRSLFDAVSVHPYSYPALPTGRQSWNTFHRLPELHDVMTAAGDGDKRLWLTEYGAPTGRSSRAVPRERQARMVVAALRRARSMPFVDSIWFYSLRDTAPRSRDPEAGFGLLGFDGRPKTAYSALRRELRRS